MAKAVHRTVTHYAVSEGLLPTSFKEDVLDPLTGGLDQACSSVDPDLGHASVGPSVAVFPAIALGRTVVVLQYTDAQPRQVLAHVYGGLGAPFVDPVIILNYNGHYQLVVSLCKDITILNRAGEVGASFEAVLDHGLPCDQSGRVIAVPHLTVEHSMQGSCIWATSEAAVQAFSGHLGDLDRSVLPPSAASGAPFPSGGGLLWSPFNTSLSSLPSSSNPFINPGHINGLTSSRDLSHGAPLPSSKCGRGGGPSSSPLPSLPSPCSVLFSN